MALYNSYSMGEANCTAYPDLMPNPDISGIGVTVAFIGTAYTTLACCIAKSIINHKKDRLQLNPNVGYNPNLDRWSFSLEAVIVSLSDQQVITGISLLVGGLTQLQSGIQIHHWESIVNLAWFSTMTHLLTLTVLRDEVRSNRPIRIFRIAGMAILMGMLVAALLPVGYELGGLQKPSFPTWCLYNWHLTWGEGTSRNYGCLYMACTYGILVYGFVSRVMLLSGSRSMFRLVFRLSREQPWKWIEESLYRIQEAKSERSCVRVVYRVLERVMYTLYAIGITLHDLYTSRTWEITWLASALAWGTIRVMIEFRKTPSEFVTEQFLSSQASWGFGQVVAVGLLVLPLALFFGSFYSHIPDLTNSHHHHTSQPSFSNAALRLDSTPPSQTSLSDPTIRHGLHENAWFRTSFWLAYALSLLFIIDVLLRFPTGLDTKIIFPGKLTFISRTVGRIYISWGFFTFAILFLPSLIFLDPNIQRGFKSSTFGRFMSRHGKLSILAWVLFISGLVMTSMTFWFVVLGGWKQLFVLGVLPDFEFAGKLPVPFEVWTVDGGEEFCSTIFC